MLRLLQGTPFSVDASAINDFESMDVADPVTDLTQGVVSVNGATWGATFVFQR